VTYAYARRPAPARRVAAMDGPPAVFLHDWKDGRLNGCHHAHAIMAIV
jgi:hypothetical protein